MVDPLKAVRRLLSGSAEAIGKAVEEVSDDAARVTEAAIQTPLGDKVTNSDRRPAPDEPHQLASAEVKVGHGEVSERVEYQQGYASLSVRAEVSNGDFKAKFNATAEGRNAQEVTELMAPSLEAFTTAATVMAAQAAPAALPAPSKERAITADVVDSYVVDET